MIWNPLRARRDRDTRRIAAVFLALPEDRHHGWPLFRTAGLASGSGYPILARMLVAGWVSDGWDEEPVTQKGRRRRYYMLTELGRREMTALLRAAH